MNDAVELNNSSVYLWSIIVHYLQNIYIIIIHVYLMLPVSSHVLHLKNGNKAEG
jgi:hypothetical protein